jgi:phosphatidylinositol alpha-mannosyltransferase
MKGNVRLIIVGEKGVRTLLCPRPLNLAGAEIVWAGRIHPDVLPRYYATADIFCSPATGQESFGIVLLEAMASGVPVVASDIPGYRTAVTPGREGFLVPPKNPEALAETLVALARDEVLRKTLGGHGREKALHYDWPLVIRKLEAIYCRVLGIEAAENAPDAVNYSRACT